MVFDFDTDLIDYPEFSEENGNFPEIGNFLEYLREFPYKCIWTFLELSLLEYTGENWNLRLLELY